jgi:hypothetical protein
MCLETAGTWAIRRNVTYLILSYTGQFRGQYYVYGDN